MSGHFLTPSVMGAVTKTIPATGASRLPAVPRRDPQRASLKFLLIPIFCLGLIIGILAVLAREALALFP